MAEITRRDALAMAATVGVATLGGAVHGNETNQGQARAIPIFLVVEDGISVQTKVVAKPFGTGKYTGTDFPLKLTITGEKLELNDPVQGHKVTLTQASKIVSITMTAERRCRLKIQPIYSTPELNADQCCWECHGLLVCALPGFCVECPPWTYCCPLGEHKAPDRPKPHE
jgi:hypothetical protein